MFTGAEAMTRYHRHTGRTSRSISTLTLAAGLAMGAASPALAQSGMLLEEIVVTVSRLPSNPSGIPGSVTSISGDDLRKQYEATPDIGKMLSQMVPGMSVTANDASSYTQTLRGRKPAVMIDGVPQGVPLRGGGRELRILTPNVIEKVEVIRGATAIYGQSGAGGVINFVTRRPTGEGVQATTQVGIGSSLSKIASNSLSYYAGQTFVGKLGGVDFIIDGSYESLGMFRDANGQLIPPDPAFQGGLAETEAYNVFGKIGYNFGEDQRIEFSGNYYNRPQDTDYAPGLGQFGVSPAPAVPKDSPQNVAGVGVIGDGPKTRNSFAALTYVKDDVLGSRIQLQGIYSDHYTSYSYTPGNFTPPATSHIKGDKKGARLDISTPLDLLGGGEVLWGVDYVVDHAEQTLSDGRTFMPKVKSENLAFFAQANLKPTHWLDVTGGVRVEDIDLDIPTFQVLQTTASNGNNIVQGGKLGFSDTMLNIGAVAHASDEVDLFVSYSQGFSVSDIGRVIRSLPRSVTSIRDTGLRLDAQVIDSYEAGVRVNAGNLRLELAGFYNKSNLGSSYDPITFSLLRAPEEVWGLELAAHYRFTPMLSAGMTATWMDSQQDVDNDGDWDRPLDFSRVPPIKLTGNIDWEFVEDWTARFQGQYVASEDRFHLPPRAGFGLAAVKSYFVADLAVSGPVGPGRLSVGVDNVFNNQYIPLVSQIADLADIRRDLGYAAGPGATATVKYTISY